jgi:hypothetical protein
MPTTRFEAWRQFLLILSAYMVGRLLDKTDVIGVAIVEFCAWDKVLQQYMKLSVVPYVITMLVVVYFVKCIHGVIASIYEPQYLERLRYSRTNAALSAAFMTIVVLSPSFIQFFAKQVEEQNSLVLSAACLIGLIATPIVIFLAFDIFHGFFRSGVNVRFFTKRREVIRRLFSNDKEYEDVLFTWYLLDVLSFGVVILWIVSLYFAQSNEWKVKFTLGALSALAFVNSIIDYFMNRGFFFYFAERRSMR